MTGLAFAAGPVSFQDLLHLLIEPRLRHLPVAAVESETPSASSWPSRERTRKYVTLEREERVIVSPSRFKE